MHFSINYSNIILQEIQPTWLPGNIRAAMLRLDLLHPEVSGNKWFKLRYNLEAAQAAGKHTILTFGGAYSNHIAATAAACRMAGLQCIGIIRGEAPVVPEHTLQTAAAKGMQLHYISREAYRQKHNTDWAALYPDAYVIPEGGNNTAGVRGCEEILALTDTQRFTHIACAIGTGTTFAGLINSAHPHQQLRGYAVLKGAGYLQQEIAALLAPGTRPHWELIHDFHGGGYARITPALTDFMNDFYSETHIPLDVVYTGKLLWGFCREMQEGRFPAGSEVLLIHTGGLQGNLSITPGVLRF